LLDSSVALGLRPYYAENTGSHPNPEVKLHQAELVLGWGTTLEPSVLQAFCCFDFFLFILFLFFFFLFLIFHVLICLISRVADSCVSGQRGHLPEVYEWWWPRLGHRTHPDNKMGVVMLGTRREILLSGNRIELIVGVDESSG
jgi:hypothetical protein